MQIIYPDDFCQRLVNAIPGQSDEDRARKLRLLAKNSDGMSSATTMCDFIDHLILIAKRGEDEGTVQVMKSFQSEWDGILRDKSGGRFKVPKWMEPRP